MSYSQLEVGRLLDTIATHAPESVILVPELLRVLVTAAEHGWPVPSSLRFAAVGGATVSTGLLARAEALGLPVYEGYGLSECASVVCLNTPVARRAGTVGQPLPHARVRIDAAGEVRIAGTTMLGYLGSEAPSAGEVASGDLGELDPDGFLRLHGRARNLIVTSFGRNVSPEWIESELSQRLDGWPVLVHGEARPYVVALFAGGTDTLGDEAIERAIESANTGLPDYAQVRDWCRAPEPFTFAAGLLTSNGRLRRTAIVARHGAMLDALYDAKP
jgi:long-subunit acyl-CoA synthetase (AMP-forming)